MIDPKELRIGNLLKGDGVIVTIDARSVFDMWYNGKPYGPIPITPEWLERLGFERDEETRYRLYLEHNRWLKSWGRSGSFLVKGDNDFGVFVYDIKHIHQLQNLFFALTGHELTVKE